MDVAEKYTFSELLKKYSGETIRFFLLATHYRRPIDFSEVSLLVRAHESEATIRDEVARRKLMHSLTPQQESTLKTQGASDSLITATRNAPVSSRTLSSLPLRRGIFIVSK